MELADPESPRHAGHHPGMITRQDPAPVTQLLELPDDSDAFTTDAI